jgi:Carboxypeptidase regulatory-like domain
VHFDRPAAAPLEIVIGTKPGAIEGDVAAAAGAPLPGATVVLLPNARNRFDLFRTTTSDPSGRFRFDRVPPGDYKIFAWDEVSDGAWQDPDFLRIYEERGTPIQAREAATDTARVQVIAAE